MSESQTYIETALPVPQYDEVYPLKTFVRTGLRNDTESHEHLAERVKILSPAIIEIIRHDVSYYQDYEVPDAYSNEDCFDYTGGIEIGYDFAIGTITYLHYLRSGAKFIDDYLKIAPALVGHIPVQTKQQSDRVKNIRMSDESIIVAPPCADTDDEDNSTKNQDSVFSGDLARIDSGNYLYYAREIGELLEYLIHDQIYNLQYQSEKDAQPLREGVHHGFNNAVEMYIQSKEQAVLQSLEF